ncbi:hypothetical protein WA026_023056 [Henosepilachna vigintioctopunctata]|uniref:Spt6 acidic N-terminal domain-containing protein n=1 Tax=Henosepilachna vigintioctopunctata TaxID=420089 RepID=A0AAW1V5U0_9CUCU
MEQHSRVDLENDFTSKDPEPSNLSGKNIDASGGEKRKTSDDEELDERLEDEDYDSIKEILNEKLNLRKFKRLKRIGEAGSDEDKERDESPERNYIAMDLFSVLRY